MEKEKIRALIMSPVMEDVLIGINFLNGAWKLKDIRKMFPKGESIWKNKYSIRFPHPHLNITVRGYKIHRSLHLVMHEYGIDFISAIDPPIPWRAKKWEQL